MLAWHALTMYTVHDCLEYYLRILYDSVEDINHRPICPDPSAIWSPQHGILDFPRFALDKCLALYNLYIPRNLSL
jgi:hypothetical protein